MSGTDGATATAAGTATDAAATTTTTAAGTTTTTDTGTAAAGTGAATQTAPTVEQLQADLAKWKALSRKNEETGKANREAAEAQKKLLAEVAAKLGIQTADGQPDPAAITAQLEVAQRDAKTRTTELAVLRAASRLGADGDALLDSRAFVAQLEGLDGTEAIEAAIKLALVQSPAKYATGTHTAATAAAGSATGAATGTASASSAGDFAGPAGGARQWTDDDVARATPAEVQKAMDAHLLDNLLGARR